MNEKFNEICRELMPPAIELLGELVNKSVEIANMDVSEKSLQDLVLSLPDNMLIVQLNLTGDNPSASAFMIEEKYASQIADYLMGSDGSAAPDTLSESSISNIGDAFSQVGVVIASSISTSLDSAYQAESGEAKLGTINLASIFNTDRLAETSVEVKADNLNFKLSYLLPADFLEKALSENATDKPADEVSEVDDILIGGIGETPVDEHPAELSEPIHEDRTIDIPTTVTESKEKTAPFSPIKAEPIKETSPNIDLLMDIPLEVTVELGRTKMSIKDVLELAEGSIVELNKLAGEPVDFIVNGKLISKGEVVVIDENFGIRITEIVSPSERVETL